MSHCTEVNEADMVKLLIRGAKSQIRICVFGAYSARHAALSRASSPLAFRSCSAWRTALSASWAAVAWARAMSRSPRRAVDCSFGPISARGCVGEYGQSPVDQRLGRVTFAAHRLYLAGMGLAQDRHGRLEGRNISCNVRRMRCVVRRVLRNVRRIRRLLSVEFPPPGLTQSGGTELGHGHRCRAAVASLGGGSDGRPRRH